MGNSVDRLNVKLSQVRKHVRRVNGKMVPVAAHDRLDLLQKKLVDFKPNRSLSDPSQTRKLASLLPGARYVPYTRTPFFDKLNQRMGVDADRINGEAYAGRRTKFFDTLPLEDVPLDKDIVVTQPTINTGRVLALKGGAGGAGKPLAVVRYQGENYILNGHHRLAVDVLEGRKSIRARVLSL